MDIGWIPKSGLFDGRQVKQGDKIQIGWINATVVGVLDGTLYYTSEDGMLMYVRIVPPEQEPKAK